MTFVVLALFGSTLVGIVRVVIALVGIAPVGIGTASPLLSRDISVLVLTSQFEGSECGMPERI